MLSDSWIKKEFAPTEVHAIEQQEALIEEMGISKSDAEYLRKSAMSAEEAVAAKKEELSTIRTNKGRKDNWLEYLDQQARMGFIMPGCEVVRRLRTILPQLLVYDGRVRQTWGLTSPIIKTFENGEFKRGWEYLGWIHADWNPEYEIDFIDEDGVPKGRRQGYRTLLLNLITRMDGDGKWQLKADKSGNMRVMQNGTSDPLKIITEEGALQAFGYPKNGPTASNYRRQLWEWRNGLKVNPVVWSL
jgi:hypothetical protein